MTLSENMRTVLREASRKQEGLRRLFDDQPGRPPWPAHPSTLAALVRHGLLERSEARTKRGARLDVWRITDSGRMTLNPPPHIIVDKPLYLGQGSVRFRLLPDNRWTVDESGSTGDYTSDPHRSIDADRHPTSGKVCAVEVLVTPADIANYARKAREAADARKQQNGRALDKHPAGKRLQHLQLVARKRDVDIHNEQRLIKHFLSQGREAAAIARIERLETQLGERAA